MDPVANRGVMIKVVFGDEVWSGSGFILNQERECSTCVVTSSSWMYRVLDISADIEDDCSILHVPAVLLNNTDVYVYWLSYKDSQIHGSKARFGSVIYLKNVHRILNQLENSTLNGWHCESTEDMRKKDPNLYLSCVVVLTLEEPLYLNVSLIDFLDSKSASLGKELFVVSTPYGASYHKVFLNSISSGCISNKYGSEGEVILTDARCVAGSEGGMIMIRDSQGVFSIAGMVMCSLVDSSGIPINATFVCSLSTVLETTKLSYKCSKPSSRLKTLLQQSPSTKADSTHLSDLCDTIVPIKFGSLVGSGFILSPNMVLTCAHVVRHSSTGVIRYRNKNVQAEVAFAMSEEQHPDIAVLNVKENLNCSLKLADFEKNNYECSPSDPVLSIGYAYQCPFTHPTTPTFTRGIISKLLPPENPVMIQTTSSVYQGMSGGLLCTAGTHDPLGLIVCVARDETVSFTHSQISFVIPFSWIKASLLEFIRTRSTLGFSTLNGRKHWNFTDVKVYSKM